MKTSVRSDSGKVVVTFEPETLSEAQVLLDTLLNDPGLTTLKRALAPGLPDEAEQRRRADLADARAANGGGGR